MKSINLHSRQFISYIIKGYKFVYSDVFTIHAPNHRISFYAHELETHVKPKKFTKNNGKRNHTHQIKTNAFKYLVEK